MKILVNDQEVDCSEACSIELIINEFGAVGPFAVALNGSFVSKGQYRDTQVSHGDKVEILSPISGG